MARLKPTAEDLEERKIRAKSWVDFRFKHRFTQKALADALKELDEPEDGKKRIGVSRRTIQQIEAGKITPHPHTITLFEKLCARYRVGKKKSA